MGWAEAGLSFAARVAAVADCRKVRRDSRRMAVGPVYRVGTKRRKARRDDPFGGVHGY